MSKKQEVIEVAPNVSMHVDLESRDIVDIHVAYKEQELLERETELFEAAERIRVENNATLNHYTEKVDAVVSRAVTTKFASIITALNKVSSYTHTVDAERTNGHLDTNKIKVAGYLQAVGKDGRGGSMPISFDITPVPEEIAKLNAKMHALDAETKKINTELVKIKMDLANIDRMERKARANMAIMALESTDAGRRMLDSIRRDASKVLANPEK